MTKLELNGPVRIIEYKPQQVDVPLQSIRRYLGMGRAQPDDAVEGMIQECLATFLQVAQFKACCRLLPVKMQEGGLDLGAFFAPGKGLAKNLAGCPQAIAFVATTGMASELQRKRAAVASPAKALVLDAIGTAAIERFCDLLGQQWVVELRGHYLRPRFSPGYGDLPLALQTPLLDALGAQKNIGITLTESLLMIPQKSVSAIVGVGRAGCTELRTDCSACDKQDCAFRL